MNSQLPPIDPGIRDQLTRRAEAQAPQDLLAGIATALDAAPAPQTRLRWPHVTWRAPQLAGASIGLALVAVLAAAIALPAFHTGPAAPFPGYPASGLSRPPNWPHCWPARRSERTRPSSRP